MFDYKNLCEDLRALNCDGTCYSDDCIIVQATAAIKELQAENERLKKQLEGLSGVSEMLKNYCKEYYDQYKEKTNA